MYVPLGRHLRLFVVQEPAHQHTTATLQQQIPCQVQAGNYKKKTRVSASDLCDQRVCTRTRQVVCCGRAGLGDAVMLCVMLSSCDTRVQEGEVRLLYTNCDGKRLNDKSTRSWHWPMPSTKMKQRRDGSGQGQMLCPTHC